MAITNAEATATTEATAAAAAAAAAAAEMEKLSPRYDFSIDLISHNHVVCYCVFLFKLLIFKTWTHRLDATFSSLNSPCSLFQL